MDDTNPKDTGPACECPKAPKQDSEIPDYVKKAFVLGVVAFLTSILGSLKDSMVSKVSDEYKDL